MDHWSAARERVPFIRSSITPAIRFSVSVVAGRLKVNKKPTAVSSRGFLLKLQLNKHLRRRWLRQPEWQLVNCFSTSVP